MQMHKLPSTIAVISCLILFVESCRLSVKPEYIAADKESGMDEIAKFHSRFNSENFETIWDQADARLQQANSKKDLSTFLNNGHEQCGNFRKIIDKRINVIVGSPVQVRVVCNSQFDKAIMAEMFIFVKTGDDIRLAAYRVAKGPAELPGK